MHYNTIAMALMSSIAAADPTVTSLFVLGVAQEGLVGSIISSVRHNGSMNFARPH